MQAPNGRSGVTRARRATRAVSLFAVAFLVLAGCQKNDVLGAKQYFDEGSRQVAAGDVDAAVAAFTEALERHTKHAPSMLALAAIFEERGAMALALGYYRAAADTGWPGGLAHLALARISRERGALDEALRHVNTAVLLGPQNPAALAEKAAIAEAAGLTRTAQRSAAAALKRAPAHPAASAIFFSTLEAEDPAVAETPPSSLPARYRLVVIERALASLDRRGKPDTAIRLLQLALYYQRRDIDPVTLSRTPGAIAARDAEVGQLSRMLAERLIHRGRIDEAAEALEQRLAEAPRDRLALLQRAEIALATEGLPRAETMIKAHQVNAAMDDRDPEVLRLRATLFITAGETERAAALMEEAGDVGGMDARIALVRAHRWEQIGRRAEAIDTLIAVLIADDGNREAADALLTLVPAAQAEAVARQLEGALHRRGPPLHPQVLRVLLSLRGMQAPSDELEKGFRQLLAVTEAEASVAIAFARYLEHTNRAGAAQTMLQRLHELRPADAEIALAYGQLVLREAGPEAAITVAKRMVKDAATRKAQGDVALTLTEEALGHGATPAAPAVDTLERVLPDHPGTALLQARLRPGPVPEAQLTLARAPGAEEAYLMLAEPLAEADPGAALSYLDHGLSACRSTLRLRLRRAALLEATGQKEAAIAEYELLHVIAPYSLLVVNNLASLLAETSNERGDLARAKRLAVRLAGHDVPEFLDTRGWVAVRNGRPQEGIPLLEAAVERLPENPAVWYHLGIASMRVGDRARARTTLAQAVRLDTSGRFRYHDVARKFLKRTDSGADALPSPSGSDLRRPSVR